MPQLQSLPYLYDLRPAGGELFKGRARERKCARVALKNLQPIALIGERRIGKTSFWQALRVQSEDREGVLFAPVKTWAHLEQLGLYCRDALGSALWAGSGAIECLGLRELLDKARGAGVHTLVFVFEELDASLFGLPESQRHRAIEEVLQAASAGAGSLRTVGIFEGCLPLLEFFEQHRPNVSWEAIELGPLSDEGANLVLTGRYRDLLNFPAQVLEKARRFSGGHPYLINLLGDSMIERINLRLKIAPGLLPITVLESDIESAMMRVLEGEAFRDYWGHLAALHLSREELDLLGQLAHGGSARGAEETASRLARKGYLEEHGGAFSFRIGALGAWLGQDVEGSRVGGSSSGQVVLEGGMLQVCGAPVSAEPCELDLLRTLTEAGGETVTYAGLAEILWPGQALGGKAARSRLAELVQRLRAKVGDDPNDPRWLIEVRGRGFFWLEDED